MSDLWSGVIGALVGVLVAPICALLIVAYLRGRQQAGWFSRRTLPELPTPSAQLALPAAREQR